MRWSRAWVEHLHNFIAFQRNVPLSTEEWRSNYNSNLRLITHSMWLTQKSSPNFLINPTPTNLHRNMYCWWRNARSTTGSNNPPSLPWLRWVNSRQTINSKYSTYSTAIIKINSNTLCRMMQLKRHWTRNKAI